MYITFHFMSLSSKKQKITEKTQTNKIKDGIFVEKQDVCQNKIKQTGQHIWFIISLSHSRHLPLSLSLTQTQISLSVSPSSVISVSSLSMIYLCLSSFLSPMMVLRMPISHHSENPNQNPVKPN